MRLTEQIQCRTTDPRQRAGRRAAAAFAVVATSAVVLAGCTSSSGGTKTTDFSKGVYGSLPAVGTAKAGGTITLGQLAGQTPTYIFPVTPAAQASAFTYQNFQQNMFLPLYAIPNGAAPKINTNLSLAELPTYSSDRKTVTIKLKSGYKWSNGAAVQAKDVVFFIDLVKAAVKEGAANFGGYTPGSFPDNVNTATALNASTVQLTLTQAYNTGYFTNNQLANQGGPPVYALPSTAWNKASANGPSLDFTKPTNAKAIYDFLAKQGGDVSTFATNPLWQDVDGPFKLAGFTPSTSAYTFEPNTSYGGSPKAQFSALKVETFTGITPQLNAIKSGSLDVASVDPSQLGQVSQLKSSGYSVFGAPSSTWAAAMLNFKDGANHFDKVLAQPYARQALAHLVDQPAYIKGVFKGAASEQYGTVPGTSPYAPANATKPAYPYSTSAAKNLLTSHGWKVIPNGQTTCDKPGNGTNQCGAGIPAGTPFAFNWFYANDTPAPGLESQAYASAARAVGIKITLSGKPFNFLVTHYNNASPAAAANTNAWGVNYFGYFGSGLYPTQVIILKSTASENLGSFSDQKADQLITASVSGGDPKAATAEADYFATTIPALFMPNADHLYAVSNKLGGPAAGWLALTQTANYPQYWYLKK